METVHLIQHECKHFMWVQHVINELAPAYGDVDSSGFRLSTAENSDCMQVMDTVALLLPEVFIFVLRLLNIER